MPWHAFPQPVPSSPIAGQLTQGRACAAPYSFHSQLLWSRMWLKEDSSDGLNESHLHNLFKIPVAHIQRRGEQPPTPTCFAS